MTAELSKAQEHARRFQELLTTERRKEKSLKVHDTYYKYITALHWVFLYIQHALEQELSKKEAGQGAGLSGAAQRAYVDTLTESLSPHSKNHGPTRIDDVIKKNEVQLNHLHVHVGFPEIRTIGTLK